MPRKLTLPGRKPQAGLAQCEDERRVRFVPAVDQNGTATITVTATDEDGFSVSEAFLFTVNPVNDPPSFAIGADPAVEEDAGEQFVENGATNIQDGPVDEAGQRVVFATDTDNPALFAQLPFLRDLQIPNRNSGS